MSPSQASDRGEVIMVHDFPLFVLIDYNVVLIELFYVAIKNGIVLEKVSILCEGVVITGWKCVGIPKITTQCTASCF